MSSVYRREPGVALDVRKFVQPGDPVVQQLAGAIAGASGTLDAFVHSCLNWVRSNISYIQQQSGDFWQFPSETLATRTGDCEDASILLCSMLRTRMSENDAFVTVGRFASYGHAWVQCREVVLEAVADGGSGIYLEVEPYIPYLRFNDKLCRRA